MAIDFVMPKLAMAMSEGTITAWLVAEGEHVEKDAELATVETEKVTYDVQAPASGYVHIVIEEGETVDCDVLIAQFAADQHELAVLQSDLDAEENDVRKDTVTPDETTDAELKEVRDTGRVKASPLARKMASQSGLDLNAITGTGPRGRIVKRDILGAESTAAEPEPIVSTAELARIPVKGTVRARIAKNVVDSLQTAAQLASSWESDITDLLDVRQRLVTRRDQLGTKISVNALLIKAIVGAIREVPIANAALIDDEIVIFSEVHMGIAMALPGITEFDTTLTVPVLRDVHQFGVVEIDQRMKALFKRARDGELTAEEMAGSTVTLSSTAGIAPPGLTTAPILNTPNALIVGPSTPIERPVVHEGQVCIRTMLPVSATFDHRVFDGERFARFAAALNDRLENPELLLA